MPSTSDSTKSIKFISWNLQPILLSTGVSRHDNRLPAPTPRTPRAWLVHYAFGDELDDDIARHHTQKTTWNSIPVLKPVQQIGASFKSSRTNALNWRHNIQLNRIWQSCICVSFQRFECLLAATPWTTKRRSCSWCSFYGICQTPYLTP